MKIFSLFVSRETLPQKRVHIRDRKAMVQSKIQGIPYQPRSVTNKAVDVSRRNKHATQIFFSKKACVNYRRNTNGNDRNTKRTRTQFLAVVSDTGTGRNPRVGNLYASAE